MNLPTIQPCTRPGDVPLERLAGNSQLSQQDKISEVSRQFEAVLLRQILSEAQKPVFNSKMNPQSSTKAIYQDMTTTQLADRISQSGGLGFGKALAQQLGHELIKTAPAKTGAQIKPNEAHHAGKT